MDKFIIKLFLNYFLGALIALVVLYMAIDAMSLIVRYNIGFEVLGSYYTYHLPSLIYQMIPVSCLVGTLFTLSELNKDNEMTALFSLGNSLARVSAPILVTVAIITVLSFWIGDRVVPYANDKMNFVYYVKIKNRPEMYSTVKTNRIWYRFKNIIFNLKTYDAKKKYAEGVTFYYFDDLWNMVQMITADRAEFQSSYWELKDGNVTLFPEESSFPLSQSFEIKVISLGALHEDIQTTKQLSDAMSVNQLRQFINKNKESGLDTLRYEVDFHAKFGFALAAFVMSFLGIPFSVQNNRSGGRLKGVGICIGVVVIYWMLYTSGITMGKQGYLPPIVAAWLPNLAMLSVTMGFLLRQKK